MAAAEPEVMPSICHLRQITYPCSQSPTTGDPDVVMDVTSPANYPDPRSPPPTSHSGILGIVQAMLSEDVKWFSKSTSPSGTHILPGLLSPLADSDSEDGIEDSLRRSRAGRSRAYRVYPRPLDIPKLDYGLPFFCEHISRTSNRSRSG
jgi:hypothetical protein